MNEGRKLSHSRGVFDSERATYTEVERLSRSIPMKLLDAFLHLITVDPFWLKHEENDFPLLLLGSEAPGSCNRLNLVLSVTAQR